MNDENELPLMSGLPVAELPTGEPLVLASGSPRRAQLLMAAGYDFKIDPASDDAECGICSGDAAPEFAARNAFRKAENVAKRYDSALVIGADTVAWCDGQILGKPRDIEHAESILRLLSGRKHDVYTGICVWSVKLGKAVVEAVRTELQMLAISDAMLAEHLESMRWEGKAGGFGFQDGNDWLKIVDGGSESNVVGLPMERLAEILEKFDTIADCIE